MSVHNIMNATTL